MFGKSIFIFTSDALTLRLTIFIFLWTFILIEKTFANPIPVEVHQKDNGWELLRGGEPYQVRGVGGYRSLELLVACGGNSVRTWGVDETTEVLLDRAHALGITVSLGIWLGHERHGFNYGDAKQVAEQKEKARQAILKYRNHPALLVWGIGNEMEGFGNGDNHQIWKAVEDIALMAQKLDPHHPVMTTTADIGGGRVSNVNQCLGVDIHGVNSYGGALSLSKRYKEAGGKKPLMFTEYGPRGTWEIAFNNFGAPPEETSTSKANTYSNVWIKAIVEKPDVLGGYAFLWGWKTEATATWYGLFLSDGTRLAGIDALADVWGHPPTNRVPKVSSLKVKGDRLKPGQVINVSWSILDPENDELATTWSLHREQEKYLTGGDDQTLSPAIKKAVVKSDLETATLKMPRSHGIYRLYASVRDNRGGGASASLPLLVGKIRKKEDGLPMPWWVYHNGDSGGPWVPSGWMGDTESIKINPRWSNDFSSSPHSIQVKVTSWKWAGVAWQYPENNWGKKKESLDLSEAKSLSFKVRADIDFGKKVKFGVGLLGDDVPYPDSLKVEKEVTLKENWTEVKIPLKGDRSRIKTGFWWVVDEGVPPITFYLDDIIFH